MAYTKIIVIHKRLDKAVGYVQNREKTTLSLSDALRYTMNRDKTEQTCFETGINCETGRACQDMQQTKERWGKRDRIRQGYHIIQSFVPGEVTPEEAHAVGTEFVRRLLGDRYEAVVTTHLDKSHLHNHVVFNSVSFVDGNMYRDRLRDYFGGDGIGIRGTSDAVCLSHGLSVIEPEEPRRGTIQRAEWEAGRQGKPTSRDLIRQDIDCALREAYTMETFWKELRKRGYTVRRGPNVKHTAIRPAWGKKNIRLDSLGEGYTEAEIQSRLVAVRSGEALPPEPPRPPILSPFLTPGRRYRVRGGIPSHKPRKLTGFRALYFKYLYLLGAVPKSRPKNRTAFLLRKEVLKFDRCQQEFLYLTRKRIETAEQLSMQYDALQAEIDALTDYRRSLYGLRRAGRGGDAVTEEIAGITNRLRPLRRELNLCARIEDNLPRMEAAVKIGQERSAAQEKTNQRNPQPSMKRRR